MSTFSSQSVSEFLALTAARTPTPGGGAVASVAGALGCALAQMVVSYSAGKKSLAAHEPELQSALSRLAVARRVLLELADEDAAAYGLVNELSRLPEGDPRRAAELSGAARASVQVPLAVAAACTDLLRLFERLAGITNRQLRSDLAIAAILAEGAAHASRWNVAVNLSGLSESEREQTKQQVSGLMAEVTRLRASVEAACE